MSASGMQASFRSESQSLLRALENGWSGFLARESADQKVASAVFEGRSGLGDFSQNGSGAGERRQQFEDGVTAALLQGLETRARGVENAGSDEEVRRTTIVPETALYA